MQKQSVILAAAFWLTALASEGLFAQEVRTLNPLTDESNVVLVDSVEGEWVLTGLSPDTIGFRRAGDNFYILTLDGQEQLQYEARFTRSAAGLILELGRISPRELTSGEDYLAAIMLLRVEFIGDTMKLAPWHYPWFYHKISGGHASFSYLWQPGMLYITVPTDSLRRLVDSGASDPGMFMHFGNLVRIRPRDDKGTAGGTRVSSQARQSVRQPLPCVPAFPLKDGWLGGDGDVSVPVAPGRTIWLFSDTWVGEKSQTSRRGARMINNSAGIMDCDPSGNSSMQYYWRDAYTQHPGSVFESFTRRYHYWVSDAFLHGGALYAILNKVTNGRQRPTAPDEGFNFEILGWTLAKIANPLDPPERWQIRYFPLSDCFDARNWRGQVWTHEGYLYSFAANEQKEHALVRIPLDWVEAPAGHLEYYAKGAWRPCRVAAPADATVLFSGDGGQSVRYHPEFNKWVMIIGPGFMNSDIRIRTAAALTGPWSAERLVYQAPEQLPGTALYDKDSFCYLGREHPQFGSKKGEFVLTYDINTFSFDKLLRHPEIYTPKVLVLTIDP